MSFWPSHPSIGRQLSQVDSQVFVRFMLLLGKLAALLIYGPGSPSPSKYLILICRLWVSWSLICSSSHVLVSDSTPLFTEGSYSAKGVIPDIQSVIPTGVNPIKVTPALWLLTCLSNLDH